ncbi:polymer-forming cytoskeletal protein [Capnocytophaga sp. oral taxon 878]|uniref:bactofilin family protein n=1 Tax=Capnocytophaga sp. oral taxon 878 TaxID=1316596 RepID=UPI000D02DAE9|nr:polymer-forming cytoskeletal protein [Capnocytophaga sp. oral taxon 878]AVM51304.1 hypothetical protein C4H12_12995 [Capnocytophaga sp. oral taxon 878]
MFNNKERDNKKTMAVDNTSGSSNRIVAETKFKGDIISKSDFRIDGEVEGTFQTTGKLVVGRTGVVSGTITCENADIEGKVTGTIKINSILSLKSTAVIEGEVYVDKLSIEPGAVFNVTCSMKGNKNFLNEKQPQAQPIDEKAIK